MNTFFVRACKKKKREEEEEILSRLGLGNEKMGFVKIQVKRVKLKRNRKITVPFVWLLPFFFFTLLLPLYLVSFARVLDVHASTIRALAGNVHRRALPSWNAILLSRSMINPIPRNYNNNLITFLDVLIFSYR